MPGPQPKAAEQRRRRNKTSTATTLIAVSPDVTIPDLPPRGLVDARTGEVEEWHPAAVDFWECLWQSPMASEYDRSDLAGLLMIADLMHDYYHAHGMVKKELAAEIRLQRREYGLGPMSRRSLQWTIAQADEATEKVDRRRASRSGGADDPRLSA